MFRERTSSRTFSKRSIHGQVAHEIGRRIVRGELPPGTVLPNETDLSQELSVSRTALREAIKVLAAKGLVESRPKIGTRVRDPRNWNMLDPDLLAWSFQEGDLDGHARHLYQFRRIIEPAAAGLVAEHHDSENLAEIERAYALMVAAQSLDEYVEPDLQFHKAILAATGNPLLQTLGYLIEEALAVSFTISSSSPANRQSSLPLHGAVLKRIRAGDGPGARQAMIALLDEARDDLRRVMTTEPEHGESRP